MGNIARIVALALLAAIVLVLLQPRPNRRLPVLGWLVASLLVWFALSYFWSIDPEATWIRLRGYAQETMIAWFVWELVETPDELCAVLRCYVAGSCVLAGLTIANFASADGAGQIRFVAEGQDPNDVARFLVLGIPFAVLLLLPQRRRFDKVLAFSYLPLGLIGVLLTASRGGLIAAGIALAGCGILLAQTSRSTRLSLAVVIPLTLLAFWMTAPHETIGRFLSIPEELTSFDLNQRFSIWQQGTQAFRRAPFGGSGAGTFSSASGLAPVDTAHNTALALAVEGGAVALILATAIAAVSAFSIRGLRGTVRTALATAFMVWLVTSLVSTVEENRTTWLLLGLIGAAGRIAAEYPVAMAQTFSEVDTPEPRDAAVALR